MLPTLPMEIIHRVFDELDGRTILFSVRNVCQRLREAVDSYHRYAFDCTSLSTPDFRRVFTLIRPECVIGLSLSDANTSPGQIGMFLSLVGISRFTRLRSMTLLSIQWQDLCLFLRIARRCSLSSLILHSRSDDSLGANEEKIVQHLSAILSQPSLTRLELLTVDLSNLMKKFQSPIQWKLRYLRMASCKDKQLSKMIAGSPQLEMLELGDERQQFVYYYHQAQEWFSTPCPRLTSLHPQELYIADRQTSISFVTNALSSLLQDHHFLTRDDGWISMGTNDQDQTRSEVRFLVRSLSFAPFHVHTIALLDLTVMRLFHPSQHLFELDDNNEDKSQDSDDRREES